MINNPDSIGMSLVTKEKLSNAPELIKDSDDYFEFCIQFGTLVQEMAADNLSTGKPFELLLEDRYEAQTFWQVNTDIKSYIFAEEVVGLGNDVYTRIADEELLNITGLQNDHLHLLSQELDVSPTQLVSWMVQVGSAVATAISTGQRVYLLDAQGIYQDFGVIDRN